ncbi:GerAB/ArcD/ProY family transporter [Alkaliphilus peptidifermentans]|uniref:Spore germination protein (Amino acid permease) n=1 Tax=Alkaliphilus peptidifermentans DSM 18978 TaxID=1120976 RepID=A0A1G5EW41_9FIRM|nr:GerAB/ArcD/ProY family transporter [Alkaliphilus peptidifermentans]SCY31199.1 spore germination protein (amino acid permease) [Alkaliphilus peptidifermentans DSM 18978]
MLDNKHKITSAQLFVFIIVVQIGIGFITLPSAIVQIAAHDGWISILLAGIISTLVLVVIMLLLKRYKDKSIFQITVLLYGKYLGGVINLSIVSYTFIAASLGVRIFTEVMKTSALKMTPPTLLTFFIMLPAIYLAWYGLKAICRFENILLFVFAVVIVFFLLIYKDFRLTFLMPVGGTGIGPISMAIIPSFFGFLGIELIAIIYPNIYDKENAMMYAIAANLFSMTFFVIVLIFLTGFYGETMLRRLEYPFFNIARSYSAPVIERVDLFFVALWFPAMGSSFLNYFFSSYYSINTLFNINKREVFLLIFYIIVALVSRIPKNLVQTNELLEMLNPVGIGLMGFLCLSYLFSFINKRGVDIK